MISHAKHSGIKRSGARGSEPVAVYGISGAMGIPAPIIATLEATGICGK